MVDHPYSQALCGVSSAPFSAQYPWVTALFVFQSMILYASVVKLHFYTFHEDL